MNKLSFVFIFFLSTVILSSYYKKKKKRTHTFNFFSKDKSKKQSVGAFWDLVGNTPLVRIKCLSKELNVEVWGKAEFLNPGGSIKDRIAKSMIEYATNNKLLSSKNDCIYEATSGNTGISLALAAKSYNYRCKLFMPSDQSQEKFILLKLLGADVIKTTPCSINDDEHFYNVCKYQFERHPVGKAFLVDQFDNLINFETHYNEIGIEIINQVKGKIDALVASSGTGGTISGLSTRLKEYYPNMKVILADPHGSALFYKVKHGVLYNPKDAEGYRKRKFIDTIIEGVGINRLTKNFLKGFKHISHAYCVSDIEAVHMSRYLLNKEGLFLGSSSALNCCALVKAVRQGVVKPGSTVIVILCDSGYRYLSKFYNNDYLGSVGLLPEYLKTDFETLSSEVTLLNKTTDINNASNTKVDSIPSFKAALSSKPPDSVFEFID